VNDRPSEATGRQRHEARWLRRARPLLGTLVEIGIAADTPRADAAFDAAFAIIVDLQCSLSRFESQSDIARFNAMHAGDRISIRAPTAAVLEAARRLGAASRGLFDITLGTGAAGWHCDGRVLHKSCTATRIDLGGIGKGHAVDAAVDALLELGCAGGWVNAGGDLRAFGGAEVAVVLRDEREGGVRPFAMLSEGAFATSHYSAGSRSEIHAAGADAANPIHVSVAAPRCLWADSLTKIVAASGDVAHPALALHGAQAWLHPDRSAAALLAPHR
jgi:thiamine biosynthesis lipoprotein